MKIYLSSDMEGTAGVVDWTQCIAPAPEYEYYRGLLQAEVNAAIDGAVSAGATQFLVNDSHSFMQNLRPDQLHAGARYLSGRHKPMYMMEGLDPSYDAVFFISYHGSMASEASTLSHTYNPRAIARVLLNDIEVGESGINALVALGHGVPIVLITGDDTTAEEAQRVCPRIHSAVVKRSLTRFAADSLHPTMACELIHDAAKAAVANLGLARVPQIELPASLEVLFHNGDFAEMATRIAGVRKLDARTVTLSDDDPISLYRTFITIVLLTRAIVE